MSLSIETLKQHAEHYLAEVGVSADHAFANTIKAFVAFVEGKNAEADAVALLESHGYTVTAPTTPPPLPHAQV